MTGTGSLAHNRRDFIAENVNPNRVYLNICYRDENLKDVYKELFDESVERYNVGKRNDRKITNYYDKIQHGKQEKLFHEVIFQMGNNKDMAAGTPEGDLAVKVLNEYMQDFQKRNPTLRVFCCYLHQDEATPHLHIDFVPYVTGWKGKGMDTRVSLKQALKSLGFQGGAKHDTELNQWINLRKDNWDHVPPKSIGDSMCSIFSFNPYEPEEIYLDWSEGIDEPVIWHCSQADYYRYNNLEEFFESIAKI